MARENCSRVFGYFLPKRDSQDEDDDNDDSEDSEMEDPLDFREINVISDGGVQIKARALKRQSINIQEYTGGKVHTIAGRFPMVDPWWAAEICMSKHSMQKKVLRGVPSYSVRTDSEVFMVIPLLFKACWVDESHTELFIHELRKWQQYENLNFDTLSKLLRKFGMISQEYHNIMETIFRLIMTGPGKLVHSCLNNPDAFEYLPQLFPKSFNSLMTLDNKQILPRLQEALVKDPWVFGYSNVMSYRFNLFGLEAPRQTYIDSGLINKLSEVQADALQIYTALKNLSRYYGHTYVCDAGLPNYAPLKKPSIKHWKEAFEFLENNKVILREVDRSKQLTKIYLLRNWKAEKSIAENFEAILKNHQTDPWTYDIDFESDQFKDFMKDADQQRAVELIASQPVVCLSGKGGCGKTHVVSRTFQHAGKLLQQEEMEHIKRAQEELFNESDVLDDFTLTQTVNEFEKSFLPDYAEKHSADNIKNPHARDTWNDSQIFDSQESGKGAYDINDVDQSYCRGDLKSEVVQSQRNATLEGSRFIEDYELEFYQEKPGRSKDEKPTRKSFPTILLTAPTGKAANLLGKRAELPSNTLHQVIYNYRQWKKQQRKLEQPDLMWKYCKVQALVVDECSLVSVLTFSTMLNMLMEEANLRKLVLLGDVNQLPSIDPGNFLTDTYQSLDRIGCSTMLKTNHRTGAQLIVHNATLISQRQMPLVDSSQHFHMYNISEVLPGVEPDTEQDDILCDQDALVRKMLANEKSLKNPKESQFVAFRRRDCDAINEICCKHYANHTTRNDKNRRWFQTGDKICCSKNATVRDEISGEDIRLCNGEIFFIVKDVDVIEKGGRTKRFLELQDEHSMVKVEFRTLWKSCKIRHAWARTIHTYQGSESGTVVYVVGSPNNQTWQHVYTAVTRGKKQVYILTRQSYLQTAVLNTPRRRNTSLKERITKMITKLPVDAFPRKMNTTFSSPNKSVLDSPKYNRTRPQHSKVGAANGFNNKIESTLNSRSSVTYNSSMKDNSANSNTFQKTSIHALKPTERQLLSNANDSQTFSDWGDDMDDIVLGDLAILHNNSWEESRTEANDENDPNLQDCETNENLEKSRETEASLSGKAKLQEQHTEIREHGAVSKLQEHCRDIKESKHQACILGDHLCGVVNRDGQSGKKPSTTNCVRRLDQSFEACDKTAVRNSSLFNPVKPSFRGNEAWTTTKDHTRASSSISSERSTNGQLQDSVKLKSSTVAANMAGHQLHSKSKQEINGMNLKGYNECDIYQSAREVCVSPGMFDDSLPDETLCSIDLSSATFNAACSSTVSRLTPKRYRGVEDNISSPKKKVIEEGSNLRTVDVSPLRQMVQKTRFFSSPDTKP